MKLDYIYHSCFGIEANEVTVIIDYYKDSSTTEYNRGMVHDYLLNKPGKIYVLATHSHPDHFNPEVLNWRDKHPNIVYVFSYDILQNLKAGEEDAIYLKKGEVYQDDSIRVEAFGSTDIGDSFLINLQNMSFFHAGDLNNWHWSEESTLEEIEKANTDFLSELKYIKQRVTKTIDVTMFPVDNRMGKDYYKGAQQFVEQIKTTIFVPMHFDETYTAADAFQKIAEENGCRFLDITHRGQTFDITK